MALDFILSRMRSAPSTQGLIWNDEPYTYEQILRLYEQSIEFISHTGIPKFSTVALEADFSPSSVGLLLALIDHACIVAPLSSAIEPGNLQEFKKVAQVEWEIRIDALDQLHSQPTGEISSHELLLKLKGEKHPGLILFSSGSTGKSKATVHDFIPLLEKFRTPRKSKRMISFLLFDHIGGVNTLFYCLANLGCLVTVKQRSPDFVAQTIAKHGVQILPTSPTFLNLLMLRGAEKEYDLKSLELITYGTEPMQESTLERLHNRLPWVNLQQTYGLSEIGILRSKSKASNSLWVRVGGEGFSLRVVDGLLEIKADSAMLGYLNASSPFTADGWFKTGDVVEQDGEFLKILGRKSEIINVGGEKVFPAEVEGVLQGMDGLDEVVVMGEPSPLTGQLVKAVVKLATDEALGDFRTRMRNFCKDKLANFKVPQKVVFKDSSLHSKRFKKIRTPVDTEVT